MGGVVRVRGSWSAINWFSFDGALIGDRRAWCACVVCVLDDLG